MDLPGFHRETGSADKTWGTASEQLLRDGRTGEGGFPLRRQQTDSAYTRTNRGEEPQYHPELQWGRGAVGESQPGAHSSYQPLLEKSTGLEGEIVPIGKNQLGINLLF